MQQEYQDQLYTVIKLLIEPISANPNIKVRKEGDQWRVVVDTDQNELLVGYKGENIKAIQHITRVIIHKMFPEDRTHFLIDIGEYKKSREQALNSTMIRFGQEEVLEKGKTVILSGLTSYERRIVHNILSEVDGIETSSIGDEGNRKLIIRPTRGELMGGMGMENSIILPIDQLLKDYGVEESGEPQMESVEG
jgi:spoIIIJ-associated protein